MKKTYERPMIIHTEKIEARASGCSRTQGDQACEEAQLLTS